MDKLINLKAGKFSILLILIIALIFFISKGEGSLLKTFENIVLLVVGFYFGSKTTDKIIDSNLEELKSENKVLKKETDFLTEVIEAEPEKTEVEKIEDSLKNLKEKLKKIEGEK